MTAFVTALCPRCSHFGPAELIPVARPGSALSQRSPGGRTPVGWRWRALLPRADTTVARRWTWASSAAIEEDRDDGTSGQAAAPGECLPDGLREAGWAPGEAVWRTGPNPRQVWRYTVPPLGPPAPTTSPPPSGEHSRMTAARFEGTDTYVATGDLMLAVNAAITLERPLLI